MRIGLVCAAPLQRLFTAAKVAEDIFTQSTSLPSFDWKLGCSACRRYCPPTAAGRSICRQRFTAPGDGRGRFAWV